MTSTMRAAKVNTMHALGSVCHPVAQTSERPELSDDNEVLNDVQDRSQIVASVTRPLTSRQAMVLGYITDHVTERGYPPTLREIGKRFGIRSTNGVNDHVRALVRKGYLSKTDTHARGLRVTGQTLRPLSAEDSEPQLSTEQALQQENKALREILHRVLFDAHFLSQSEATKLFPSLSAIRGALFRKEPIRPRRLETEEVCLRCRTCGAPQTAQLISEKPLRSQMTAVECVYCGVVGNMERHT
jgi:SOS-response transcriptional repressor LexA